MTISTIANKKALKGANKIQVKQVRSGVTNITLRTKQLEKGIKFGTHKDIQKQVSLLTDSKVLDALSHVERERCLDVVASTYKSFQAQNFEAYYSIALIVASTHKANCCFMSAKDSVSKMADGKIGIILNEKFGIAFDQLLGNLRAFITLGKNPQLMDNLKKNANNPKGIKKANGRSVKVMNFNSGKAMAENCRSLAQAQTGAKDAPKKRRDTIKKGSFEYMQKAIEAFRIENKFQDVDDFQSKVNHATNAVLKSHSLPQSRAPLQIANAS